MREGPFGKWYDFQYCPNNLVIVGFRLKSERQSNAVDDAGALNIAVFCGTPNHRGHIVTLEGEVNIKSGKWTADQFCPSNFAVCGIRTQIEKDQEEGDDTGLNNVQMNCCPVD